MPNYSSFVITERLESRHFSRDITQKIIRFHKVYTTADLLITMRIDTWNEDTVYSLLLQNTDYDLWWRIYIVLFQLTNLAKIYGRGHQRKSGPGRGHCPSLPNTGEQVL